MYQDLSFMRIPLPEDVLKLKSFGDFEGAQKMIQHFLSKDIPQSLRKRLEIEENILQMMGNDEYPYTYEEALEIINKVRNRARLKDLDLTAESATEEEMLQAVLHERNIEFAAEGKRWYDLVRFGKMKNYRYKDSFIEMIVTYNSTANVSWLRSVLSNEYAWYLPISQSEIDANLLLVQNPYYAGVTD